MKRLMYAIPLSVIAVLVFAAIAVAQDVPKGQQEGQAQGPIAADANTTGVRNTTTVPAKKEEKKPAEPSTPTESAEPSTPTEPAEPTTPTQTTAPDPNGRKTVNISDGAFNPAQLNITPGTTVRFVNKGTEAHTATADNDLFDTGELEPGESFEVYFEGSGSVTYHCELHPDMKGSIVVGKGVGEEATAPQESKAADEAAPNSEPSSEADEQDTEAAKPSRGY